MTLKLSTALLCLGALLPLPVLAQDAPPPAGHPGHAEFCKNNPTTCEVGQERRDSRKAWCEQNPEKCKALKDERKARVEKMKEKCAANPAECEAKKAEIRERMKERRERRQDKAAPAS